MENDVSAHSGEERPQYDAMMAAALAAAADPGLRVIIAAYHPSRLWRRPVERAQAIEDLRQVKAWVGFEAGGLFNLSKATDRSQLRQVGENDTAESEVKAERVARAARERAEEGRANGRWAYGWREYECDEYGRVDGFKDVEDPERAAVVRAIVRRLLAGESLISITQSLNKAGVPSPGAGQQRKRRSLRQDETGSLWNKTSVKKIATRDMNIAIRTHAGKQYPAAWPALISEQEHARIKALFAVRTVTREKPGQRKHLLSWDEIAVCGICGSVLRVGVRGNTKYGKKRELYLCDAGEHVGRNKEFLDLYIADLVAERLERPDILELLVPEDDEEIPRILEQIVGLEARQSEAADDYADGAITREQLRRINQRVGKQLEEARRELTAAQPRVDLGAVQEMAGPGARERWDALHVVRQRHLLEVLGLRLEVHKVTRRGPGFDPDSIKFPHGRPFGPRR